MPLAFLVLAIGALLDHAWFSAGACVLIVLTMSLLSD
jgi:hypothetical protein